MPDPTVRHARTSEPGWGPAPSRSAQRRLAAMTDPEPAKRPPGKKETKRWCKGKVGREHVRGLVFSAWAVARGKERCGWASRWNIHIRGYRLTWACRHREVCVNCGRVFREPWDLAPEECPAYPGDREQQAAAEAQAVKDQERRDEWLLRYARPRRVITGRQSYRKPKAAKR